MHAIADEITRMLSALVGLRLSIARRGGSMRIFHFGDVRQLDSGSAGEFALHLQCGWRIESSNGQMVTGASDVWEPEDEARRFDPEFNYDRGGNLQDKRIGVWLGGYDPRTRSQVNEGESLVVERVEGDAYGGAVVVLSGGYRLVLFPDGTRGEHWRFFKAHSDDPHFVVTADGIEQDV